ncbi:glycosyltransferase involved in cell wall biosynthesis [Nocardioides ginsengisegetis]|uniref:Glycosyltransferase involved in cell wall biosynthesis n=1 Tax=Nocardioides ginsengisegetis TaxID=661491 RepID=A0A7W3J1L1_9ACTN|nr:glycosyltransferase [Nocardioides ginsengisegetis]MBA8804632.1 glycosyltransferase involved in cell wall biosynthesis [Nocardioides ginsengisegetis]
MAKLLLLAPDCDGTDVGEAWVTMQWVRRVAARHDVTVLVQRKRDRASVLPQLPGVRVVEWVQPPLLGRFERLNSLLKPGYVAYYVRAARWLRAAGRRGERFDLAHQLSPVAMRYPSPLAGGGTPYLLGPVGGSLASPPAFHDEEGGMPWFSGLRALDGLRLRRDPLLRRSFASAACVIGIADYVREMLDGVPVRRFEQMSDTGVDALPPAVDRSGRPGPLRLLFVGRVIRTKGVRDAVRALALADDREHVDAVLDVVGEGYDRVECERLAQSLGVGDRVTFHGRVPHEEVGGFYERADVFLFPSYREPGGIVVAEAMAWGLPVVACNAGGPASTLDDSTGIRVDARSPDQYAEDLAGAVARLARDPGLRARLGAAARARVEETALWDRKVDWLDGLYRELIG